MLGFIDEESGGLDGRPSICGWGVTVMHHLIREGRSVGLQSRPDDQFDGRMERIASRLSCYRKSGTVLVARRVFYRARKSTAELRQFFFVIKNFVALYHLSL